LSVWVFIYRCLFQVSDVARANQSMLRDLDRTLEQLLKHELPSVLVSSSASPDEEPQVEISFAPPDNEFGRKVKLPAIGLFLYDVRENLNLRGNGRSLERSGNGMAIQKRPPIRLDCSYLVTAWPSDSSDYQTEHLLLGEAMKVLVRYPQLPEPLLQGSLKGQDPPLRALALRPTLLNSLGEFWQAIGGKPKAALNYTVTISVPVDEQGEALPLVVERQVAMDLSG
jgi:Pvc16 N-terminal domain